MGPLIKYESMNFETFQSAPQRTLNVCVSIAASLRIHVLTMYAAHCIQEYGKVVGIAPGQVRHLQHFPAARYVVASLYRITPHGRTFDVTRLFQRNSTGLKRKKNASKLSQIVLPDPDLISRDASPHSRSLCMLLQHRYNLLTRNIYVNKNTAGKYSQYESFKNV